MSWHGYRTQNKWRLEEKKVVEEEEGYASLIKRCPNMRILRQIHGHLFHHHSPFFLSKLLSFCLLSPHGDLPYASKLFSSTPSPTLFQWNLMLQSSSPFLSFSIFRRLLRRGGPPPNSFTFSAVLKACSLSSSAGEGRQTHTVALRSGAVAASPFVGTALVTFYSCCDGDSVSAHKVFDEITEKGVVAWSSIISGYGRLGMGREALLMFGDMQKAGVVPDVVTLVSVLAACAVMGALEMGRWVHAYVRRRAIGVDLHLGTSLMNMYAKCGCVKKMREVFDGMEAHDAKCWSSFILGLAVNGMAEDALTAFSRMQEAKIQANLVTYIGVISACAHGGLVAEGRKHWERMVASGIEPSMELHGCMVDLLCRAKLIKEAWAHLEGMTSPGPNAVLWRTLVMGCIRSGAAEAGEAGAGRLLELEPENPENHLLLCNLYASAGEWEKVGEVRRRMRAAGIRPAPGFSTVEVDRVVHRFVAGEGPHPEALKIHQVLKGMEGWVRGKIELY